MAMERGCWEGRDPEIQAILKFALRPLVSRVLVVRQSRPRQGLRESRDRMRKDRAPVQGPRLRGQPRGSHLPAIHEEEQLRGLHGSRGSQQVLGSTKHQREYAA